MPKQGRTCSRQILKGFWGYEFNGLSDTVNVLIYSAQWMNTKGAKTLIRVTPPYEKRG